MTSPEILKKADVFKEMNDERLMMFAGCSEQVEFVKNERIFLHGADATHVWILVEGSVELRSEHPGRDLQKQTPTVSFVSQAQAFGWRCFVPPYKYRLSGYCASEKCSLIKFRKEDLLLVFESDKNVGFQVMLFMMGAVGRQFEQLLDEIAKRRGMDVMSRW